VYSDMEKKVNVRLRMRHIVVDKKAVARDTVNRRELVKRGGELWQAYLMWRTI
jgi:hypothetical protein